jgi:hypothetical protein
MSDGYVNGIPTAKRFQKKIGRTGLRLKFKMTDTKIDEVLAYLQNAEYWRGSNDMAAVSPLRMLRKSCLEWMAANQGTQRASRPHITELCRMVHLRMVTVIEYNLAIGKEGVQKAAVKNAMHAVHDQIRMRRVGSSGAGRSLDSHYSAERGTSSHLAGTAGKTAKTYYDQACASGSTTLGFEDWVKYILVPCSEDDPFRLMFTEVIGGPNLQLVKANGVKYCNPAERDAFLLTVRNGVIRDASDAPYHTGMKETAFSGRGWAIYVVDFDKNFYSESHRVNEFHHSSFLAGAPVQAAGEIAVDRGKLVALTNKTGHYKAGAAELARALRLLQKGGVDIAAVAVNDPFKAKDKWVSGTDALAANGDLTRVAATVPTPAKVLP